jgi:hypothetical protein
MLSNNTSNLIIESYIIFISPFPRFMLKGMRFVDNLFMYIRRQWLRRYSFFAMRKEWYVYPLLSHIIKTNFSFLLYLILRLGSSLRNVISCYCICHFLTHELWLWSSMSRRMDQVYVTPYGAIYKVHSLQEMSYMTNLISCLLGGKSCLLDKKGWLALLKKYDVIVIYC